MKQWYKPNITYISATELSKVIKARAMSVGQGMELGDIYDTYYLAAFSGLVKLPDTGYVYQAQVIGSIIGGGIFIYEVITALFTYRYRRMPNGDWVLMP